MSLEDEILSGKGMVEVYGHVVGVDGLYDAVKSCSVLIDEGYFSSGEDVVGVEVAVHAEGIARELDDVFFHVGAVGLVGGNGELELVVGFEVDYFLFEGFEDHAEAADELEGLVGGCAFDEVFLAVVFNGVEGVGYFYVFVHVEVFIFLFCKEMCVLMIVLVRASGGVVQRLCSF